MAREEWLSDLSLDADSVRGLLYREFDELRDAEVAYFNEGFDSWIFRVGGNYLFRFPKRQDSAERLECEIRLLPEIEDSLSLTIPAFEYVGEPSEDYPFRYAGYERLDGTPAIEASVSPEKEPGLARQLGSFLRELHSLPAATARRAGVPEDENLDALPAIQKDALEKFETTASLLPADMPDRLKKFLDQDVAALGRHAGPSRLIHNDFCNEHILLDAKGGKALGVVDWGDAELGDPAMDFAGLIQWKGAGFLDAALKEYGLPLDARAADRARFIACCEGMGDVHYGLKTGKKLFARSGALAVLNALR